MDGGDGGWGQRHGGVKKGEQLPWAQEGGTFRMDRANITVTQMAFRGLPSTDREKDPLRQGFIDTEGV